jgi:nucleoside-diphosphate-sugar epimerase
MEHALVTGVSGLIGRHVAASLVRSGLEVHGLARSQPDIVGVTMHHCDILDHDATANLIGEIRPGIVVHCAWVTTHGIFWHSPENLDWLGASLSLLRSARDAGMRRFVGVGTGFEYEADGENPKQEYRSAIAPATLYGSAKDALNRVAERFAITQGIEYAWARVFMLYGGGEHPDRFTASLARALLSGRPARMSSGKVVRDFLDARDVGAAIAMLAASRQTGIINVGSGDGITLRALGERLAEIAGHPDLLAPGALPDRPGEPQRLVADICRLKTELGFRPSVTLDRGLADVLDYWRNRGTA